MWQPKQQVPAEPADPVDQQQMAERLLAQAKEQGAWSALAGC